MMSRLLRPFVAILAVIALPQFAMAAPECPSGGDETSEKLESAASCKQAAQLLDACMWGSTMDVSFSEIVIDKCEQDFLSSAPKARVTAYRREQAACDRKYAGKSGSMYIGMAAVCRADVAAKYSGH